jgi:hypothetical protein
MSPNRQCHYIAAYLRRHLDYIGSWDRAVTMQWVKWFIGHGRALMLTDGRKVVGVTLVRLMDEPEQATGHYFDNDGHIAYIEVTACDHGYMPYLFTLFRQTFPRADKMAWCRNKHGNRPVMADMKAMANRLAIKHHHG